MTSLFPEAGRLAAHVLLDAASAWDDDAGEANGAAMNLALTRLAETGAVAPRTHALLSACQIALRESSSSSNLSLEKISKVSQLTLKAKLGEGYFGYVYEVSVPGDNTPYALKCFKKSARKADRSDVAREIALSQHLADYLRAQEVALESTQHLVRFCKQLFQL